MRRLRLAAVILLVFGAGACGPAFPEQEPGGESVWAANVQADGALPNSVVGSWHQNIHTSTVPASYAGSGADDTLTVAVVSDLNGRYGSTEYDEEVDAAVDWITGPLQPDLVVSTGDHVAGQREGLDYAAMWRAFHAAVTEPFRRAGIPFAPTPGNHDASAVEAYAPERHRYIEEWSERRPSVQFDGSGRYPLYYAFERGPALFISLDITVPGPLPDEQMQWLRSVLERHEDKPAKIVFAHLPLVPFAEGRESEIVGDPELEALLDERGVDAVLSGHHHAYYPGRRGDIKMIGMACLGGGPRKLIGTDRESRQSVALLKISPDGGIQVSARHGPAMQKRVDRRHLPRALRHDDWTVWRLDVPRRLAER